MGKLTVISYTRKAATIGATIFSSSAAVATGFAAWVIASTASQDVAGNVSIGVVSDKSITIEVDDGNRLLSFNPAAEDVLGRVRWDGTNSESLTFTVAGRYSPASYVSKFTAQLRLAKDDGTGQPLYTAGELQIDEEAEARFEAAASAGKNYIVLPTVTIGSTTYNWTDEIVLAPTQGEGDVKEFTVTYTFGWGSAFGNVNPSVYFDDAGKSISDETMKETMNDFVETITGLDSDQADLEDLTNLHFVVTLIADTSAQ